MYNVFIVKISMHLPVKVRLELNLVYFCFVFLFIIIIFVLYMYHQMVLSKTLIRLITLYSFRENLRLSTNLTILQNSLRVISLISVLDLYCTIKWYVLKNETHATIQHGLVLDLYELHGLFFV